MFLRKLEWYMDTKDYLGWFKEASTEAFIEYTPSSSVDLQDYIRVCNLDSNTYLFGIYECFEYYHCEHVGNIKLYRSYEDYKWYVGLLINPKFRGKGYGSKALESICRVAKELGIQKIIAGIKYDNIASLKSFEKAGFYKFCEHDTHLEYRYDL